MKSSFIARLSLLASLPILIATVGCTRAPSYGPSNPATYVGSSASLATFGTADNPATVKSLNGAASVTSMVFFQQSRDVGPFGFDLGALLSPEPDCNCEKLFYISGGSLNVAYNNVGTTDSSGTCTGGLFTGCTDSGSADTDAPRVGGSLQTKAVPLSGGASALYAGSDGGAGTDVFVSGSDGKIHLFDGVTGSEDAAVPVNAHPQSGGSSAACVAWQPHQLAIPAFSQSSDRGQSGNYALLGASSDGKSVHALMFPGFAQRSPDTSASQCQFYDIGDVGPDASSIAADANHTLVANPTLSTLYLFDVLGNQKAQTVTGAYAVAIADGTGWVTQNLQGASTPGTATNVQSSGHTTGFGVDDYYSILADTTGQISDLPEAALVVTSQPTTWVTIPGAKWIAPAPDQSNAARNGKYLNSTTQYELYFDLADPSHTSLDFTIAADDYVDVTLNGKSVFTHTSTSMSGATAHFTISSGFMTDNNLEFYVSNATGGPTGMILGVAASATTTPATGNIVPVNLTSFALGTPIAVGKCPTLIQPYYADGFTSSDGAVHTADGPSGTLLYVSNTCDSTISVVDPAAKKVVQTIKLTAPANAIAVEP